MNKTCPTTVLYNTFKSKFQRGIEKAGKLRSTSCDMTCFTGKISDKIFKKFEKDRKYRDSLTRGVTKNLSIMFTDIRGFTTRTSMMQPERIVQLLDLFIPEMLGIIIERHRGMVDKLLGDGIMALFGHPYPTGEEIVQALYSAIDMQQAASAMDEVLRISGYEPIEIGVGINYGEVLICEVGNDTYRESTVIGAPVNVAAKMEDIAGAHEVTLPAELISEIEKHKPRMVGYFEDIGIQHGVQAMSFNWTGYIENEQHESRDWRILG